PGALVRMGLGERVELHALLVDAARARVLLDVDLVPDRIRHLGHEKDVRHRRRRAVAERAALRQRRFQAAEPLVDPVRVPAVARGIVRLQLARQIPQHAQVVQRVDVACHELGDGADARAGRRVLREQRRLGMGLVQVLDDRHRLEQRLARRQLQRRNRAHRIDALVLVCQVLLGAQVEDHALVRQPLQSQRDADAKGRRGEHRLVEPHSQPSARYHLTASCTPCAHRTRGSQPRSRRAPAPEHTQCGWVSSRTLSSVSIWAVFVILPQSWVAAAATFTTPMGIPKRTNARRPSALSISASASRHTYTAPSSTKYARPDGAPAVVSARTIAAAQSATYTTLSVFLPPPVIGSTPLRTEVKKASVSRSRGP